MSSEYDRRPASSAVRLRAAAPHCSYTGRAIQAIAQAARFNSFCPERSLRSRQDLSPGFQIATPAPSLLSTEKYFFTSLPSPTASSGAATTSPLPDPRRRPRDGPPNLPVGNSWFLFPPQFKPQAAHWRISWLTAVILQFQLLLLPICHTK